MLGGRGRLLQAIALAFRANCCKAGQVAHRARGLRILVINTGYILTGMIIMGAILGGWKKKAI